MEFPRRHGFSGFRGTAYPYPKAEAVPFVQYNQRPIAAQHRLPLPMSDKFAETISQNRAFLALAGSLLFADRPSFDLRHTDRRTGDARYLARTLAPMLLAYGFPPEAGEWLDRVGAPGGVLDVSLTLSLPGTLAGAWLRAPGERDSNFFGVYSKVSVALQRMMRRWVPFIYFSDPGRYEDVRTAFPLIFYRSTWPCSGRRGELAYDLVSPERPGAAQEWTARPFAARSGASGSF